MKIGDRVFITGSSSYGGRFNGRSGEVRSVYMNPNPTSRRQNISVLIDGSPNPGSMHGVYYFGADEVQIISPVNDGGAIMGKFKRAQVQFLSGSNVNNIYNYALFPDTEVETGDVVVVQTGHHGMALAKVAWISDDGLDSVTNGREVICKVDMAAYEQRKERRAKMAELKRAMDDKVRMLQEQAIYEMLAKEDKELGNMLAEFKALSAE